MIGTAFSKVPFKFLMVATSLAISACAPNANTLDLSQQENGIIGGEAVTADAPISKSIVQIVIRSDYNQGTMEYCSGALIAPKVILTAAHCFDDMKQKAADLVSINFNINSVEYLKINRMVVAATLNVHPQYDESQKGHDVAILTIAEDAPNGYTPTAINLEQKNLDISEMQTYGYGLVREIPQRMSETLKTAKLESPEITETELSASQRSGNGVCFGDSGGPVFATLDQKNVLVAVNSRVKPSLLGPCRGSMVATRTDAMADFITPFLK